jgi:hypothetical protein
MFALVCTNDTEDVIDFRENEMDKKMSRAARGEGPIFIINILCVGISL